MKLTKITVTFSEDKLVALTDAMEAKGKNVEEEIETFVQKLYEKNVHSEVRKFIDKRLLEEK